MFISKIMHIDQVDISGGCRTATPAGVSCGLNFHGDVLIGAAALVMLNNIDALPLLLWMSCAHEVRVYGLAHLRETIVVESPTNHCE